MKTVVRYRPNWTAIANTDQNPATVFKRIAGETETCRAANVVVDNLSYPTEIAGGTATGAANCAKNTPCCGECSGQATQNTANIFQSTPVVRIHVIVAALCRPRRAKCNHHGPRVCLAKISDTKYCIIQ